MSFTRRVSLFLSLLMLTAVFQAAQLLAGNPAAAAKQAANAPRPPQGFLEILFSGGYIGILIMLVLIGMSLTMVYLVFENALSIRQKELLPTGLKDQVHALVLAGRISDAGDACRKKPSLLAFVLTHGLSESEHGWADVEKALEDALAEQSARLLRKIEYLSVLGNIGPMVGLLGTVVGMLLAFKEVASTAGKAGAAQLAEGIYQALVTTVVGLMIAIPALCAFAVFRNRVDQFIAEASFAALHALGPLKSRKPQAGPTNAPPPPPPSPPPPRGGGR